MIQYVELTEDVLDMFFDLLEEEECLLKETPTEANITGEVYMCCMYPCCSTWNVGL